MAISTDSTVVQDHVYPKLVSTQKWSPKGMLPLFFLKAGGLPKHRSLEQASPSTVI